METKQVYTRLGYPISQIGFKRNQKRYKSEIQISSEVNGGRHDIAWIAGQHTEQGKTSEFFNKTPMRLARTGEKNKMDTLPN